MSTNSRYPGYVPIGIILALLVGNVAIATTNLRYLHLAGVERTQRQNSPVSQISPDFMLAKDPAVPRGNAILVPGQVVDAKTERTIALSLSPVIDDLPVSEAEKHRLCTTAVNRILSSRAQGAPADATTDSSEGNKLLNQLVRFQSQLSEIQRQYQPAFDFYGEHLSGPQALALAQALYTYYDEPAANFSTEDQLLEYRTSNIDPTSKLSREDRTALDSLSASITPAQRAVLEEIFRKRTERYQHVLANQLNILFVCAKSSTF